MKKTLIKIVACSAVLLGLSSCNKFLDIAPDNILTEDLVFSNETYTEEWLSNVYSWVKDGYRDQTATEGTMLLGDELTCHPQLGTFEMWPIAVIPGNWSPSDYRSNLWSETYKIVRTAYIFIEKAQPLPNLPADRIERYKKEARFLIAYHYFKMLQFYGPFPLITKVIPSTAPTSELLLPRTNINTITDWLWNEFDELGGEDGLPDNYDENYLNRDIGRPLRGTALAMAAEVRLWAASPLFNGNPDFKKYKNPDGTFIFDQGTENDPQKWQDAKTAYAKFFDYNTSKNKYTLYKEYTDDGKLDPIMSLTNLFLTDADKNKEMIWYRVAGKYGGDNNYDPTLWYFEDFCLPRGMTGFSGCMGITVDALERYFTENGRPITDPEAGWMDGDTFVPYKATGFSTKPYKVKVPTKYNYGTESREVGVVCDRNTFNMFVGREPRFYTNVQWQDRYRPNKGLAPNNYAQYAMNQHSGGPTFDSPPTGMQGIKLTTLTCIPNQRNTMARRPSMLLRLAEMNLHYAEVLAELGENQPLGVQLVNEVRERAGIPTYGSGEGQIPIPSDWKQAVRNELVAEMALEGQNYHNFRRWKIAQQHWNKRMRGFDISVTIDYNNQATREKFFTVTDRNTIERRWFKKFYLWPIPQPIIDKNANIVQNPFWLDAPDA